MDILVIGSGIAGLSLALKVAEFAEVTILTKKNRADTATNLAQGGIAAAISQSDSPDYHFQDTIQAGAGLCHEEIARLVVENGPARFQELVDFGVRFQTADTAEGYDLGMEGGHSVRRVAHAKDLTGREIEGALLAQAEANSHITILEDYLAIDLLLASKTTLTGKTERQSDRCLGAYALNRHTGEVVVMQAKVTLLCTGGCGKVYLYTTNPDIATGDGVAMAYRAGAKVANLEFVQFHPTCFYSQRINKFLVSEAVRGEGGILVNSQGIPFMKKYDSRGDLATRDAVARGIDAEMKASGALCVFLDISHRPSAFIRTRFPTIYQTCLSAGVDITQVPIPVVPAAHYMCGGVVTDQWGRTSIDQLYALGETACTGLHGANRLASNSLLEAVVFAHQAATQLKQAWPMICQQPVAEPTQLNWHSDQARNIEENVLINHNWEQIRRLMWNYVGIVRRKKRLALVARRLAPILYEINEHFHDYLLTPNLVELRNIGVIAELIVTCASQRQESRGLHYLVDLPACNDDDFKQDTVLLS